MAPERRDPERGVGDLADAQFWRSVAEAAAEAGARRLRGVEARNWDFLPRETPQEGSGNHCFGRVGRVGGGVEERIVVGEVISRCAGCSEDYTPPRYRSGWDASRDMYKSARTKAEGLCGGGLRRRACLRRLFEHALWAAEMGNGRLHIAGQSIYITASGVH